MLVSKWEINRIGLIDFWYYDDEEFHFADGKMLLRGANGSGKSVTMQSFIPLLLDGNKSPDRLDPFGTKARKMENYLLEENDGREERIGYLYMEFKRKESDSYFSMGIGLRARKNKKLESWYFAILDGRRIGKDMTLYKDLDNKVSLSKTELKNKLGEGGIIMETQKEYMKFINDRLFGYETVEEYKELIDLLVQLRMPKLSKDFKPTVLNEILSNSLQTLSEDDLRPMSEAIENMDSMKSRLDDLKESKKAADKIRNAYEHYNKKVLYDKAKEYKNTWEEFASHKERMESAKQQRKEMSEDKAQAAEKIIMLREELLGLEKKKRDLDASDVTELKQKQLELEGTVRFQNMDLEAKDTRKTEKEAIRIEVERNLKDLQQKSKGADDTLRSKLNDMGELAEEISFDEFEFVKAELLGNLDEKYDLSGHMGEVFRLKNHVKEGIALLSEAEKHEERHETLKQQYEDETKVKRGLENEKEQLESQEIQVKNEFTEKVYQWNRNNTELILSEDEIRKITLKAEQFDRNSDFTEIASIVLNEKGKKGEVLQRALIEVQNDCKQARERTGEKERELKEWVNKKDPEPEKSQAVLESRKLLAEKRIPYTPFYKIVDFADGISEKQADILEEALLDMGVLDALIIPSNYENQVLGLDEGVCDKYLFSSSDHVKNSINNLLCMDMDVQDLVLNQSITNLIESMGSVKGSGTFIDKQGNYGMGVLQGTVTKHYKAKYIGVKAREKFKQETVSRLEAELASLSEELHRCEKNVLMCQSAVTGLGEEYSRFPVGTDICEAVRQLAQAEDSIQTQNKKLDVLETDIKKVFEKIKELRIEISKLCHKTHLEGRRAIFEKASEELGEYEKGITEIGHLQDGYLQCKTMIQMCEEQLSGIDGDLDNILYDIGVLERAIRSNKTEIDNCEERLKLSNYEDIRRELDYCLKRLGELPGETETEIALEAKLSERLDNLGFEEIKLGETLDKIQKDVELTKTGFMDELKLGYVYGNTDGQDKAAEMGVGNSETKGIADSLAEDADRIAANIIREYTEYEGKPQSEYMQDMQSKFHEHLSEMAEYKLQLKPVFPSEDYEDFQGGFKSAEFSRLIILGKYQSKSIEFPRLIVHLAEDIETQEQLITESDREIFEDILVNTISKKIRAKIYKSEEWVKNMNGLMDGMDTSSGLKLNLRWKNKKSESESQLDTRELVELLKKDAALLKEEEFTKLSKHFQSKVEDARRILAELGNTQSFHSIMRDVLDYRQWFEFQLYYKKTGEEKKELTNNAFFTLSGGEKAMAMYVPLFSAVVAKYQGANEDAPKLISLDEAFAGVDETNIRDMFKLMIELDFQFIINSQILWGDYDTVPKLAVYQLLRPENAKYVTVIPYLWNGRQKILLPDRRG